MWHLIIEVPPPFNAIVQTKIHDDDGERNVCCLRLIGRLWFHTTGETYVYYTPTHWRFVPMGDGN